MIARATAAAVVLALGAAAPASAFIGPYTGVGSGTSDHNGHQENSDQTFVVNSHHTYSGRFTYSFRIDTPQALGFITSTVAAHGGSL